MLIHSKLVVAVFIGSCALASMTACAMWPFSTGPRDIKVTSVTDVNFKDQTQFDWAAPEPRPSKILSRIDFTTNTDLLALAKKHDYNVSFILGQCTKDGMKDNGKGLGSVYWGKTHIYFGTRDAPGYTEAIAKGPPFTYQAYSERLQLDAAHGPLCFTLAGGAMLGGRLRSNDAVIPNQ